MNNFCQKMNCDNGPYCKLVKSNRGYECKSNLPWDSTMCHYVNFNGKYNYGIREGDIKTFMYANKIEMAFREEFPNERT